MHGTCKLCGSYAKLEKSHIRPKFIAKWMKKTSITGYIRRSLGHPRVNKRVQDFPKDYWLCGDCEDRFSVWEGKFASNIFYPFVDRGESTAHYGEWLRKFCASLSWRTLTHVRSMNVSGWEEGSGERSMDLAEEHLARYLLGEIDDLGHYEQHLFHLGALSSSTAELPSNFNRYMLRASAEDIVGNPDWLLIYTKLPTLIILGLVKAQDDLRQEMRPSLIAKSGTISPREYTFPTGFYEYLEAEMNSILEAQVNIPQEEFDRHIAKDPEKAYSSKQFEAFLQDLGHFGDVVFKR